MSNIFQALEQAQREKFGSVEIDSIHPGRDVLLKGISGATEFVDAVEKATIVGLCRAIEGQLQEHDSRIVQFICAQQGEGVSSIVRKVARTSADHLGRNVLIIEAGKDKEPSLTGIGGINKTENLDCSEPFGMEAFEAITDRLFTVSIPIILAVPSYLRALKVSKNYLGDLGLHFDLILIDTPSLEVEPYCADLVRYADGVVMVLEAERTKFFTAENLKNKIFENGGHVLGVVLNKRCYYIPKLLYKRLC